MSYTKKTWVTGEVIEASELNHMEDGIEAASSGGGVLVVNVTQDGDTRVCDKTAGEICAALPSVAFISVVQADDDTQVTSVERVGSYAVVTEGEQAGACQIKTTIYEDGVWGTHEYIALSADAYPTEQAAN